METKELLNKVSLFTTEYLRKPTTGLLIADAIICIKDKVSFNSWAEDIEEAPEDYAYTSDDLEIFLFHLNN